MTSLINPTIGNDTVKVSAWINRIFEIFCPEALANERLLSLAQNLVFKGINLRKSF